MGSRKLTAVVKPVRDPSQGCRQTSNRISFSPYPSGYTRYHIQGNESNKENILESAEEGKDCQQLQKALNDHFTVMEKLIGVVPLSGDEGEDTCQLTGTSLCKQDNSGCAMEENGVPYDTIRSMKIATPMTTHGPVTFSVGDYVRLQGTTRGEVKYVGLTHFTEGTMIGIELEDPIGKHGGSYGGQRYFCAPPNCGVFAPPHLVETDWDRVLREQPIDQSLCAMYASWVKSSSESSSESSLESSSESTRESSLSNSEK